MVLAKEASTVDRIIAIYRVESLLCSVEIGIGRHGGVIGASDKSGGARKVKA